MKKKTLRQIKEIIISLAFSRVSVGSDLPGSLCSRTDGRVAEGARKAPASAIHLPEGEQRPARSRGAGTAERASWVKVLLVPREQGWTWSRGPSCGVYSPIKHQTSPRRKKAHRLLSLQTRFALEKRFSECAGEKRRVFPDVSLLRATAGRGSRPWNGGVCTFPCSSWSWAGRRLAAQAP